MFVIIALGGNALLRRGEAMSPQAQRRNVSVATDAIEDVAHIISEPLDPESGSRAPNFRRR